MSGDASGKDNTLAHNKLDSTEELDDEICDAMLGGLRRGMITIRNNAKETLEKCETGELRNEMEELLKSSTIKLIRSEKSYLETARIVAQVVDEISSEFEDDQDREDAHGNILSDVDDNSIRPSMVFRPTFANTDSIVNVAKRMATMFTDRIKDFENSLTEDHLQNHPKYKALETQINLAESQEKFDTPTLTNIGDGDGKLAVEENDFPWIADDEVDVYDPWAFEIGLYDPEDSHIYSNYIDYSQVDFSFLPSVDPISRQPIHAAVKNKYCNHVFEDMSIREFMALNPDSTCPMYGCSNKRKLEHEHLIFDPNLNDRIHQKHHAAAF